MGPLIATGIGAVQGLWRQCYFCTPRLPVENDGYFLLHQIRCCAGEVKTEVSSLMVVVAMVWYHHFLMKLFVCFAVFYHTETGHQKKVTGECW
mmetsp:Transcript_6871/g.10230  ORF Transcript_6871/g.10230 Transcript_6871/m.10230 type:complete len:93 (+) Transcript_6871:126-404(+)